jgi:hypothetical protein
LVDSTFGTARTIAMSSSGNPNLIVGSSSSIPNPTHKSTTDVTTNITEATLCPGWDVHCGSNNKDKDKELCTRHIVGCSYHRHDYK